MVVLFPRKPDPLMWMVIVHCLLPGAQIQMLKYFTGPYGDL